MQSDAMQSKRICYFGAKVDEMLFSHFTIYEFAKGCGLNHRPLGLDSSANDHML